MVLHTERLKPTAAAAEDGAKGRDRPWERQKERRYKGQLGAASSRKFSFKLRLEGHLSLRLLGPSGTSFDLFVASVGVEQGTTDASGSRDA